MDCDFPPPPPALMMAPPPPPPPPGAPGAYQAPTYRQQQDIAREQHGPASLEEQQYANLPSKLMTAMNKDKKPFSYTLGAVGDKGILDLSQIKSPRMKKRLMANLRGDENAANAVVTDAERRSFTPDIISAQAADPFNISGSPRSTTPDLVSNIASNSSISPKPQSPLVFRTPPPPQRQFDAGQSYSPAGSPSPQIGISPLATKSISSTDFERSMNEQLDGLTSCLQSPNGSYGGTSPYKTRSPQPFEPYSPLTPPQSRRVISNPLAQYNNGQIASSTPVISQPQQNNQQQQQYFNVPPPKKVDLPQDIRTEQNPPLPANPSLAYTPTLQEQWQRSRQAPQSSQWQPEQQQRCASPQNSSNHNSNKYFVQPPAFVPTTMATHVPPPPPGGYSCTEEENNNSTPIQSKSFKILQKLTEGIEDELEKFKLVNEEANRAAAAGNGQQRQTAEQPADTMSSNTDEWQPIWRQTSNGSANSANSPNVICNNNGLGVDPRYRGSAIPSNSFKYLQDMMGITDQDFPEMAFGNPFPPSPFVGQRVGSSSPGNSFMAGPSTPPNFGHGFETIIPVQVIPPSQQGPPPTPPVYRGSSIPSRSFRALQMMTGEEPILTTPGTGAYGTDF